ncbi:TonB-dependent receptor [Phenylobacterium sp. LjRoot219]|uniref:TonB-dependent receptor n=1 Tax=Phenylobacterium sp. LjRoot219 TaxID=3342283 RepID=UPI003ECF2428
MNTKAMLLVTSALGLGMAAPALAQEAVQFTPQGAAVVEDVIVTARRVEERLQDVPISMTVYSQEQLTNRNVVTGRDLATYTPSLSANSRFGTENTSFSIRGFNQELRTTASVAVYFADVVAPRSGGLGTVAGDGAGPGSFFDLQNVQVLKGPQGTLFGRNTTGGAILLVPQKPTDRFEGYAEVSLGNYDMRRFQAVVNAPLGDIARLRVGLDQQKRDGYVKNLSGVGPSRFSDIDYTAARASLVVDVTPDIENYSIASYQVSDNNGPLPKMTACNPTPFPFGPLSCGTFGRLQGDGFYVGENTLENPQSRMAQWQLINTTTWRVSDALTVKNIISYAQLKNTNRNDLFGARFVVPSVLSNSTGTTNIPTGAFAGRDFPFVVVQHAPDRDNNHQDTFTEELQFQGDNLDNRLIWQAGGYFEKSTPLDDLYGNQSPSNLDCTDVGGLQCTDILGTLLRSPIGSVSRQLNRTSYRNIGLYAQGTYDLTEQVKLTAGLRYTWDKTSGLGQNQVIRFPAANDPRLYCLDPRFGPVGPTRTAAGALDFSNAIPISQLESSCREALKQTSDKPTWLLGLDYKPTEDVLLYGKYSRGYRQGSINPYGADGYRTFGPEKVDTYEVGAKTSWRGAMPGLLNIAAYYNDFRDQQISTGFRNVNNIVSPNSAIVNAGRSRIWGVEVESSFSPFRDFRIDASYAYLNATLTEFTQFPVPASFIPGSLYDTASQGPVEGGRLPFSPKNKATITASYTLPVPETVGEVTLSGTYSYTSDVVVIPDRATGVLPSVELVNLNLNWNEIAGKPVDASFFVTNLTKEKYYTHINDQLATGFMSKYLGEPRMYGVRLRARFGG